MNEGNEQKAGEQKLKAKLLGIALLWQNPN
jgi:hypothetical protein